MSEKIYDKEGLCSSIRQNLDTNMADFVKAILDLPEGENKQELLTITFADIFQIDSITNPDECLASLIEKWPEGTHLLAISDIQKLIRCDREILSSTLRLLSMNGGMNGYKIITDGERRGKKYRLEKKL